MNCELLIPRNKLREVRTLFRGAVKELRLTLEEVERIPLSELVSRHVGETDDEVIKHLLGCNSCEARLRIVLVETFSVC